MEIIPVGILILRCPLDFQREISSDIWGNQVWNSERPGSAGEEFGRTELVSIQRVSENPVRLVGARGTLLRD